MSRWEGHELKPSPPIQKPPNPQVKHGRATVSWGPRLYGPDTIVCNAPVDCIADLVEAVALARKQIEETA